MWERKKVMIIDDDKEFLEELTETLSLSDYEPVMFDDPALALQRISKEKPDVILLDLKMFPRSGFEIAHELKHIAGTENIPIIAMTGFYKNGYESLMKMCGIKNCLIKPFKPLDIIAQIEEVLSN
ncbi:MAG: response regulator [Candidatus Ratteibacteria bacterium]|nr:response regulator [Candidatus Ratteibacteria bacterium]